MKSSRGVTADKRERTFVEPAASQSILVYGGVDTRKCGKLS